MTGIIEQFKKFPYSNENLSVEEIQTALFLYTAGTWFKSSSKAKDIEILNVEYSWAHVYHIQCYNQMRQVKEKYCSECCLQKELLIKSLDSKLNIFKLKLTLFIFWLGYRAGRLDDATFGPIPGMWEIQPAYIPKDFERSKEKAVMPHSETVRTCGGCRGRGYNWETTSYTDSDGKTHTREEKVTCSRCGGNGG